MSHIYLWYCNEYVLQEVDRVGYLCYIFCSSVLSSFVFLFHRVTGGIPLKCCLHRWLYFLLISLWLFLFPFQILYDSVVFVITYINSRPTWKVAVSFKNDDECDKTVFHNTTSDLQDHATNFFWSETGLVLRVPTVSDHIIVSVHPHTSPWLHSPIVAPLLPSSEPV